ncbi:hypothetical protein D3C85_1009210 [compost metagenome]
MLAVCSRKHVQVVTIEVFLSCTIPSGVTIGLGIQAAVRAIRKALGTAITSRFAARVGRSNDGGPITSYCQDVCITEQT